MDGYLKVETLDFKLNFGLYSLKTASIYMKERSKKKKKAVI